MAPAADRQCGVQTNATSVTVMFALVGLREMDYSFS